MNTENENPNEEEIIAQNEKLLNDAKKFLLDTRDLLTDPPELENKSNVYWINTKHFNRMYKVTSQDMMLLEAFGRVYTYSKELHELVLLNLSNLNNQALNKYYLEPYEFLFKYHSYLEMEFKKIIKAFKKKKK